MSDEGGGNAMDIRSPDEYAPGGPASRLRLGRRSSGLTGVQAARAIRKVQEEQIYGSQGSPVSCEALVADAIDEPACT